MIRKMDILVVMVRREWDFGLIEWRCLWERGSGVRCVLRVVPVVRVLLKYDLKELGHKTACGSKTDSWVTPLAEGNTFV